MHILTSKKGVVDDPYGGFFIAENKSFQKIIQHHCFLLDKCLGRMINEYYSFISPNQHESRKTCSHWAPSFWYTFPEEYISKLMSCRESGKAEIDVPIVYSSKAVVNTIYH
ncbi:hypothetical protein CMV_001404 [Castanea mollissima]|uniref:Uncharacterized protein n=1 Tax=Castanea mollissima TaxID=60419 RepID=A0A8J4RVW6_9ROSI|nr:hypothetical protein CMV_001404 [Castanea mollissima]